MGFIVFENIREAWKAFCKSIKEKPYKQKLKPKENGDKFYCLAITMSKCS